MDAKKERENFIIQNHHHHHHCSNNNENSLQTQTHTHRWLNGLPFYFNQTTKQIEPKCEISLSLCVCVCVAKNVSSFKYNLVNYPGPACVHSK